MEYIRIGDIERLFFCHFCMVLQRLDGHSTECPMCMCESLEIV